MKSIHFHKTKGCTIRFFSADKPVSTLHTDDLEMFIRGIWRTYAPRGTTAALLTPDEPVDVQTHRTGLLYTPYTFENPPAPSPAASGTNTEGPEPDTEGAQPAPPGSPGRDKEWTAYGFACYRRPFLPLEMVRIIAGRTYSEGIANTWQEATQFVQQRNDHYLRILPAESNRELYPDVTSALQAMKNMIDKLASRD